MTCPICRNRSRTRPPWYGERPIFTALMLAACGATLFGLLLYGMSTL